MNYRALCPLALIIALAACPAYAHHAASLAFDTSLTTEIEGYVADFSFSNPHINITLVVTDESGTASEWVATGPSVPSFRRRGWTDEMIEEGQYVRLVGRTARNGVPMILIETEDVEGGRLIELDPADGSLVRVLEGSRPDQTPADLVKPELKLSDGRPNLSGTWLGLPARGRVRPAAPQLNETGQALQLRFDPTNDPAYTQCEPPGFIRVVHGGQSVRLTQTNDYVLLESEGNGTRRFLYLDGRSANTDAHTPFGHSVARYEGNALVVETSQLPGGLMSNRGNELSDMTTVVETYRRADDSEHAALQMELIITDPGHLAAPWEMSWRKLQTYDYEFAKLDCRLPQE